MIKNKNHRKYIDLAFSRRSPVDTEKKRIQGLIDQINRQLEGIISQSIGGSSVTSVIDYTTLTGT